MNIWENILCRFSPTFRKIYRMEERLNTLDNNLDNKSNNLEIHCNNLENNIISLKEILNNNFEKYNNLIDYIAWWIPIKKYRYAFKKRFKFYIWEK